METSKHTDRERRRTKPKPKAKWAKFLLRPQTVTFLVTLGRLVAFAVWLVQQIRGSRE